MVVDQINIDDINVIETKNDPPVPGNGHAPEALQAAGERVQPQAGEIDVPWHSRRIQSGENSGYLLPKGCVNLRRVVTLVEAFQSAMPKTADHTAM